MLGVDGVVLHGGVEPQAVALLAVVEGALERLAACALAGAAPRPRPPRRPRRRRRLGLSSPSPSASASSSLAVGLVGLVLLVVVGLELGLELGGHERVVLGAQVRLLGLGPA